MLSIDRFEGEYAVCIDENGNSQDIHISKLPDGAKEGVIIKFVDNIWTIDINETQRQRERIKKLQDSLWE